MTPAREPRTHAAMPDSKEDKPKGDMVEETILALVADRAGKTICPTDAARAIAAARGEDDLSWRRWLSPVRNAAKALARQGRLVIYRKGKPADPDDFRGVIRLGLPRSD